MGEMYSSEMSVEFQQTTLRHTREDKNTNKQTPWPLVRERTIPTERPPLVDEI
jgi:hypothetical protein